MNYPIKLKKLLLSYNTFAYLLVITMAITHSILFTGAIYIITNHFTISLLIITLMINLLFLGGLRFIGHLLDDKPNLPVPHKELNDIPFEKLLCREPVEINIDGVSEKISEKVVLVTGAGGSIGSEICRQIAGFRPSKLILLGHGENSIYSIETELTERYSQAIQLVTEIADIKDKDRIHSIMKNHKPQVIYHAAAHKHVTLMERNPDEAVKNNILGTKNLADAANQFNVETFVMISTDKAVNPASVMGATKRIAEILIQQMDRISSTRFVAVRFGNVLGSSGSVIPIFRAQISKGGPITITHPEMKRYFMTIPEASSLVIEAGALAQGGEIFVLDMGEPVRIIDLAKNLIKLLGYSEKDIEIKITGIRPGEKLFEEILSNEERTNNQIYPKIYVGKSTNVDLKAIEDFLITFHLKDSMTIRKELIDIANGRYVTTADTSNNIIQLERKLGGNYS